MTQPEGSRQHAVGQLSICSHQPAGISGSIFTMTHSTFEAAAQKQRNVNTQLTVSSCRISTPSQHRMFWYDSHFVWILTALRRSLQTLSRTDVTMTSARDVGSNIFAFRVGHLLAWRSRNQIK